MLTWPKGAQLPKPQERQAIESTAASTLGMRGAKPKWQFTGPRLKLRLVPPVPPPRGCSWTASSGAPRHPDLRCDAIRQAMRDAGVDDLVLGIGQDGKIVKVSLQQRLPAPRAVRSTPARASRVTVRCLLSQVLFRGGIAAILDNKLVSHPSLRGLPNVAYCDDIDKIHDFLCWLDGELDPPRRVHPGAHRHLRQPDRQPRPAAGGLPGGAEPDDEPAALLLGGAAAPRTRRCRRTMRENLPAVSPAITGAARTPPTSAGS